MNENEEKKTNRLPFPCTGSTGMVYQITPHLRYAKVETKSLFGQYSRGKECVLQQMWQGEDGSQIWKDIEEVDIS